MKRFMKFLAPEAATGAPAAPASIPTIDVPDIAPATQGSKIEEVKIPSGILSPKEALGEDASEEMEKMEAQMEKRAPRERGPDGKFIKKDADGNVIPPAKPAVMKPKAAKPAPVETPKAPEKFKIGDEEKTPEEWAKELKEAREKIAAAAKTPNSPQDVPPEPKPEEIAAQGEQRIKDFIAKAASKYLKKPEELDEILSGGEGASAKLAEALASVEHQTTVRVCGLFNKELAALHERISPLEGHHKLISDYQADQSFLDANADIKGHPKGYETYKTTEASFRSYYGGLKEKVAAGTATPVEQSYSIIFENQDAAQRANDIAHATRAELAKLPVVASPNAAPVVPKKPAISPAASKPFNGDRPGGSSAAIPTESDQARQIREMREAGR